jgi:hypothetical protein
MDAGWFRVEPTVGAYSQLVTTVYREVACGALPVRTSVRMVASRLSGGHARSSGYVCLRCAVLRLVASP